MFIPTETFYIIIGWLVGSSIGSFINVVAYRVPLKKSIAWPPSSCPKCGARIKWYDNVPVVSWIILRGKCRNCKGEISIKYPLIEMLGGAAGVIIGYLFA